MYDEFWSISAVRFYCISQIFIRTGIVEVSALAVWARYIESRESGGITFCITLCEKFSRFTAVRGVMWRFEFWRKLFVWQ